MRQWLLVISVLSLSLAGCADPGEAEPEEEVTAADENLQATDSTGVIRGVVVDSSIVPLQGAKVAIGSLDLEGETLEDGSFGFGDLEPGTYFLEVSKPGYLSAQTSAVVEAGVEKPPAVTVQLALDDTYNPYSQILNYKGLYQCGTSVVVVCGAPNILLGQGTTDDTSTPTFEITAGADHLQTEMVWKSTQALSPQLYFEVEAIQNCPRDDGSVLLYNAEGQSPLMSFTNGTDLVRHGMGVDGCGAYHSVFAGDLLEEQHCQPGVPCPGVGFSIQQEFEWFVTSFYGYTPPEGWWFINDGEYLPPE